MVCAGSGLVHNQRGEVAFDMPNSQDGKQGKVS